MYIYSYRSVSHHAQTYANINPQGGWGGGAQQIAPAELKWGFGVAGLLRPVLRPGVFERARVLEKVFPKLPHAPTI